MSGMGEKIVQNIIEKIEEVLGSFLWSTEIARSLEQLKEALKKIELHRDRLEDISLKYSTRDVGLFDFDKSSAEKALSSLINLLDPLFWSTSMLQELKLLNRAMKEARREKEVMRDASTKPFSEAVKVWGKLCETCIYAEKPSFSYSYSEDELQCKKKFEARVKKNDTCVYWTPKEKKPY